MFKYVLYSDPVDFPRSMSIIRSAAMMLIHQDFIEAINHDSQKAP